MDAWTVVERRDLSEQTWDDAVVAAPDGWLWHRHRFQDVLATWPARRDHSFALVDGAGTPVAIVPAHVVTARRFGVSVRRVDVLGGPCVPTPARREHGLVLEAATAALRQLAARTASVHVTVTLPSIGRAARELAADATNPLVALGYRDLSDRSWVVATDLGEEEVWARVQPRTRRYIRAASSGAVAVRSMTHDDLPGYHRLHRATCARTGAAPHPIEYFEAMWRLLVPAGLTYGLVAECDGVAVAACHVATDRDAATWWTAAADDRGLAAHANDVIVWEVLRRAGAAGIVEVDLGEAHVEHGSEKHHAIAAFKRKFGGTLRPLHRGRLMTARPPWSWFVAALDRSSR